MTKQYECKSCRIITTDGLDYCPLCKLYIGDEFETDPCPFCGKPATGVCVHFFSISGRPEYRVDCRNDDCKIHPYSAARTAKEAVDNWNRRDPPTASETTIHVHEYTVTEKDAAAMLARAIAVVLAEIAGDRL
jgi:hypothetical protein